jgi:hypothetical protein
MTRDPQIKKDSVVVFISIVTAERNLSRYSAKLNYLKCVMSYFCLREPSAVRSATPISTSSIVLYSVLGISCSRQLCQFGDQNM